MILKPKRLEYLLKTPLPKINNIIENIDSYYYEKKEIKKNKDGTTKIKNNLIQYRILTPSKGKLKFVQKFIKISILSKIEFPYEIQGGVKGRDNITNAKKHQGKKYHFCTDLKNFFPSISSKMVYNMFIQNGFSPDVSRILTRLTTYKGFLPQGAPTSTHVANLVFWPIDKELIKYCKINNITYTRFVDDLSFSSQKNFHHKTEYLLKIITDGNFSINHRKTFYKSSPSDITGVV